MKAARPVAATAMATATVVSRKTRRSRGKPRSQVLSRPSNSGPRRAQVGTAGKASRWGLAEDVAHAADGVDQPRFVADLGLAAQVADVDLERVRRGREVEAPDLVEQPAALEHPARVPHECLQQGELGPGEADRAGPAQHLPR